MFKLCVKLIAVTLVLLGVCTFLSVGAGKAAAEETCVPANGPTDYWGIQTGDTAHGMASLRVHAHVGTYTHNDSNGNTSPSNVGEEVDVGYQLNSKLAPGNYNTPPGVDPDARIFQWPLGRDLGRDKQHWFRTGETISAGPDSRNCKGWSVLGPSNVVQCSIPPTVPCNGTIKQWGNGWVLDCQEFDISTQSLKSVEFWVSDIGTPGGQSGRWEIKITQYGQSTVGQSGFLDANNPHFTAVNGANTTMDLIWHPNPPPPKDDSSVTSECTYLDVTDGGDATINGKNFGPNDIRTTVRVSDSSGHVMVHGTDTNSSTDDRNLFLEFNNQSRHWDYDPPLGRTVTVQVYRQYYHNDSGTWQWDNIPVGSLDGSGRPYEFTNNQPGDQTRTHKCYDSTCSMDVPGNVAGKPHSVKAGQSMSVSITVKNLAGGPGGAPNGLSIPGNLNGQDWRFLSDGAQSPGLAGIDYHLPTIARGGTMTATITMTAPQQGGIYTFSAVPVYPDLLYTQVSPCTYSFDVYQHFDASLTASTSLSPSRQEPTTAAYSTSVGVSPSVYIPTTSIFCKQPAGNGQQTCNLSGGSGQQNLATTSGGTYPSNWSGNYAIPDGSFNAGDQYCAAIHANYTTGWVGPHGPTEVAETNGPSSSAPSCKKVVNQPYTHFMGNDVTAGGGFGNSCQKDQKGVIYTYNNKDDGKGGSGTQFGAHAMDVISGLGTASLRSNPPVGLSGLAFANTTRNGSPPNQTTGGFMGDAARSNFCVPDYFSDKPDLLSKNPDVPLTKDTTSTSASVGSAGALKQWYKPAAGTALTLNSGTIRNGMNQAIFVEGNVNIIGDGIKYSTDHRNNVTDIPSFYLVVKNGNIRIDPSVKQLDGVYVAQPDTSDSDKLNKTGIINTCYIGTSFDSGNTQYNQCKNQLVVNGAFVANRVLLARSYSSLRYSHNGEYYIPNAPSTAPRNDCGNATKDVPSTLTEFSTDCAAEIFNFSPELYMSQPAINARYGAPTGKFDSITSLSPVL